MPRSVSPTHVPSPLLALLLAAPHDGAFAHVGACAVAILPPPLPGVHAEPNRAAGKLGKYLGVPLMLATRAVVRRPQVRQLALRVLKRFPGLYARAYGAMMASNAGPVQEGIQRTGPALSARTAAVLHMLDGLPAASADGTGTRRRLAMVSPLPPQRTGIATYAVELLLELTHTFAIDLVVDQADVTLPPALAGMPVRSSAWFAVHGGQYDEVLYHFGNSPYHSHMLALLAKFPGVVVLHDFFLGGMLVHAQMSGAVPYAWREALLHGHGYEAVRASQRPGQSAQAHKAWPASLGVLEAATRVIVHSRHARQLAIDWYGAASAGDIDVIPQPRKAPPALDRAAARAALGIADDCFLVCSFGFIAPNKLTHELLHAWLGSTLHQARGCMLVLVGANHDSPYGVQVEELIRSAGAATIRIAGWTDQAVYCQYLQAADAGVQLRTNGHGESSGAVLDCLNYGLPTIVNANGSMAEFPSDTVWRLPDRFDVPALTAALESLWHDPARRMALGAHAVAFLDAHCRPAHCARLYLATLDQAWAVSVARRQAWRTALARPPIGDDGRGSLAAELAQTLPVARRQLLVDISDWAQPGATADALGCSQLLELLGQERAGLHIAPVWLDTSGAAPCYRVARNATGQLLGLDWPRQPEPLADVQAHDIFYAPDAASPALAIAIEAGLLGAWRARGVIVNVLVRALAEGDGARVASSADRLLCISAQAAQQLGRG